MPPLKLKIALEEMPHPVSRKLLVPRDVNMRQMHFLIQLAIGWANYHMWEFNDAKWKGEIRVSMPMDDDFDLDEVERLVAHEVSLKETFLEENGAKPFWYWYDFGDDWWHKISFLKTNKKDIEQFDGTPVCLEAIGGCPPEDCGGPWGYHEFLETINSHTHPDHKEMREWAGLEKDDTWPTEAPGKELINEELKDFFNGPDWASDEYSLL